MTAGTNDPKEEAAPASPTSPAAPSEAPATKVESTQPPPPPTGPPTPRTPSEPWRRPTVEDLAALVLSDEGRRERAEASAFLVASGPAAFAEWYRQYDDGFSDDGPSPVSLLLAVGVESSSIGTCEARYEDSQGHVRQQVTRACSRLGLSTPSFDGIRLEDGKYPVVARLGEADAGLRRVGLRLLFIDPDSDMYYFAPVTQQQFTACVDTSGEEFDLRGIDWIT